MNLSSPKEAEQFLHESLVSYQPVRSALIMRTAVDRCMYEGIHWLEPGGDFPRTAATGRRSPNWNPDGPKGLRATVNRIIPLIRESAAATYPDRMEFTIHPPDRDMGIEQAERAQVLESMLNIAVDHTGYLKTARTANIRRCIDGTRGIGLRIKMVQSDVGNGPEPDHLITAFDFDSTRLTLDPFNQNGDLRRHEYVIYSDVWTRHAVRVTYGLDIPEDECATIGELMRLELELNRMSENRLYANLPKYSKTKGVFVHQLHVRDDNGYFKQMFIGFTTAKSPDKVRWVNMDNPESPFGGYGLPMVLLRGAERPDSMWSMSDVYLIKDDQDRINLLNTFTFRQLQANSAFKHIMPIEGIDGDRDNVTNQFNNRVGGVLFYKSGTRDKPIQPPQLLTYPQPQPFVTELANMFEASQRKMVHRHEVTTGNTKSHVPNETFQSALNQAGQVLGNRVREDMDAHEQLMYTLTGTIVKLANEGSPSILAMLGAHGFDADDFSQVARTDPYEMGVHISLRESSIRYVSKEEKEQRLWSAVQAQAISPLKLRVALADMDTPLDDTDRAMMAAARKAANRVLMGEEWMPVMLGEHAEMFLSEFRRAMVDRRAVNDPQAKLRLDRAIQNQLSFVAMEQEMLMPEQPAPAAPPQGEQPAGEVPQEVNIADVLMSLSGAGGEVAQPVTA